MSQPVIAPRMPSGFPYRWELMLWLWLAFFFNQADRQVFGTVLPQIRAELGLSDVQAGLIASVFTAMLAVMVPIAGYMGDRIRQNRVVVGSVFAWSLATLLTGFAASFAYLVGIRSVATAVGEATYAPSANALIAAHHAETRARAMAVHQTSLYAGVIVSGLLAGTIADRYGWRSAFWVFGAAGVLLSLALAFRLHPAESIGNSDPPPWSAVRRVVMQPPVLLLAAAFGCMVFVNVGFLTWMPSYLNGEFHLTLAEAGFSSMVYHHAAALLGVAVGGLLSDQWARREPHLRLVLQGAALLAGAPFLYWLGVARELGAVYLALAFFGLFRGIYDAGIYASLYELIPARVRSTATGLVIAFAYLIGAFAPVALGAIKQTRGLAQGFSSLAAIYALGAVLLFVASRLRSAKSGLMAATI